MVFSTDRLTKDIVEKYGDRKAEGRLSLLIDHENCNIYPVPLDMEHVKLAKDILNIKNIKDYPTYPIIPLVPSLILIEEQDGLEKIVGILTGNSGLEQGYGVKHHKKALSYSHDLAWLFVSRGELPIGRLKENKILFGYST